MSSHSKALQGSQLQWQSQAAATESVRLSKPETFTIGLLMQTFANLWHIGGEREMGVGKKERERENRDI